jgi:signal transduction histidine kinase
MTLTTRITLFFLLTLAAVLVGFSATLYILARSHVYREVDARQTSVLTTLSAAADVDSEGVEWNPAKRQMHLDQEIGNADVRWVVLDNNGRPVDRSRNLGQDEVLFDALRNIAVDERAMQRVTIGGNPWRLAQRRLGEPAGQIASHDRGDPGDDENKFPAVHVAVAISLQPAAATLRELLAGLCGLCAAFWILTAFFSRRMCRRALAPVRDMAAAARKMRAADLDQRLPDIGRQDELEDLRKEFNGLLCRVQESFERQKRFAGDASHQLRTPLTAMLGQIEVALRRQRPVEEYQRVLALVQGQANRLRHMIETLLFLAQLDAEAHRPELQPIDVCEWMSDHLASWAGHSRAADFRTDCSAASEARVNTHPFLLGQLLDNLLDNACKYSQPGTLIKIGAWCDQAWGFISVEDAGCGISATDLPHIFEPFYRSNEARRDGIRGVGLGLSVAQRIAYALGGQLSANSEPISGTRLTLRLARLPVEMPAPGASKCEDSMESATR